MIKYHAVTPLNHLYLLIKENLDYEEGTSTITESDAAASSVDAELNNSPGSFDVSTAATEFEGKLEKQTL